MASLFRPVTVKAIPPHAERVVVNRKQCVRWPKRGGGYIVAELAEQPGKCRVRSPNWWIEYTDARGMTQREKVGRDRAAAEHRKAQIITDVERQKGGLVPRAAMPTSETLTALAADYRRHLEDMGRTVQHAADTHRRITTVLADCRWVQAQDVTVGRWVRWVGEARAGGQGFSSETVNHYLRSLRAFFRWLVRSHHLPADPLAAAELLNADADRRIRRRVLSPSDFRRFIDSTRASDVRRVHLDGPARAALYLIAARTGLRAAVLAQLTPESLRLSDPTPHIPVEARRQKGRKGLRVPIPAAVLTELGGWLAGRTPGARLWPGLWHAHGHASSMVRRDLKAAGLAVQTPDGSFDFHALRSQFVTDLARAGVPVQVAQQLAGHSTPTLTSRYYTHLTLADLADAANRLDQGDKPTIPKRRRSTSP